MSKPSTKRPQVRPESVEDLPPGTEEGRLGISRVISPNKREAETLSRNSVAETSSVMLAAMAELDRREAAASTRPTADIQTDNDNFPKLLHDDFVVQRLHALGFGSRLQTSTGDIDHTCASIGVLPPQEGSATTKQSTTGYAEV